jgi:hypothetical protein
MVAPEASAKGDGMCGEVTGLAQRKKDQLWATGFPPRSEA